MQTGLIISAIDELSAMLQKYVIGPDTTEAKSSTMPLNFSLTLGSSFLRPEVENIKTTLSEIPAAMQEHQLSTGARFNDLEQSYLDYYSRVKEIQSTYTADSIASDKLLFDAKADYAAKSFGSMSNFFENLYVMTGSSNEELFNIMKTFAVAEATIQGYRAAVGAYAFGTEIGGPVLGAAFAASALAATGAQIANIIATEPGSTTSISSTGEAVTTDYEGGSTEAYTTTEATPSQNITIQIYNPLSSQNWAQIVEDDIIPALNDASDRNINITIGTA